MTGGSRSGSVPAPSFATAGGCTLYFDPRYDTECKWDTFHVDYWNGAAWTNLANFNATSNNPGSACGGLPPPPADHFGNVDTNRLVNCDWQERTDPGKPAFKAIIPSGSLPGNSPKFRWRFDSDGGWDDLDGAIDTDGAAYIDNVWVSGDLGNRYKQDFEASPIGQEFPQYWSLLPTPGVAQGWHLKHDADPPYEGGDGGSRTTCLLDSSWAFRARPENGYPPGSPQRVGFNYGLMSPRVKIADTGAAVQYDMFACVKDPTCDYVNTLVRFYDKANDMWCPWVDVDGYFGLRGGCTFWLFDRNEGLTALYDSGNDSLQFMWQLFDNLWPGLACRGKHTGTEFIVDNVSIGFFDGSATTFTALLVDLLHDSFLPEVDQAFNSFFDAYNADSISWYPIPRLQQLYLDVADKDGISSVVIEATIDKGATWVTTAMTLDVPADSANPSLGGTYYGTVKAGDLSPGATSWTAGSEIWYHVLVTDNLSDQEYLPARANPSHPAHDGTIDDHYHFAILPRFPPAYTGPKILLVVGNDRSYYDYSPCLSTVTNSYALQRMYENTLRDAGYCYDKYEINSASTNLAIPRIWFTDYDAVVWFTGPYFTPGSQFYEEAQIALRAYMADGGKAVLCGDRIAFGMASIDQGGGSDLLGGEFLGGIMGSSYLQEMESAFDPDGLPLVYAEAAATVSVFGAPKSIPLDSLVIYRECPYLQDMSYIETNLSPPAGYTAQPLLHLTNPIGVAHADEAVYTEYQGVGQCVYVNFDLSALINHTRTVCAGRTPAGTPTFDPGYYYGRVELMRAILYDLFGLPPNTGGGGAADVPAGPRVLYRWALHQNSPNPVAGATEIIYEVGRAGNVSIKVYNAMGQMVKVLQEGRLEPNRYVANWDGTNQAGERVSSGVYFYRMQAEGYSAARKMAVVK